MTTAESAELLAAMTLELSEARRDRASYRLLAQQAIHALAALQQRFDQQQQKYHRLLDEVRDLRQERAA